MKRYFAYGSNMDSKQMNQRCPENRLIGKAFLPGYRWIITSRGYASVLPSQQDAVEGVLFEISEMDEARLDNCEGVDQGSYIKQMARILFNGDVFRALIYIDPEEAEGSPRDEYIRRINQAVRDAALSEQYVKRYIRQFIPE